MMMAEQQIDPADWLVDDPCDPIPDDADTPEHELAASDRWLQAQLAELCAERDARDLRDAAANAEDLAPMGVAAFDEGIDYKTLQAWKAKNWVRWIKIGGRVFIDKNHLRAVIKLFRPQRPKSAVRN